METNLPTQDFRSNHEHARTLPVLSGTGKFEVWISANVWVGGEKTQQKHLHQKCKTRKAAEASAECVNDLYDCTVEIVKSLSCVARHSSETREK